MSTVQPQHPVVPETAAALAPPAAGPSAAPAGVPVGAPQRFRGRTLEALLPQIRAALGPDAIVLRRREGLSGGVGGFFQQRFVEVEAVAGAPRGFDAYDDAPAWPEDVSADGVRWLEDGAGTDAPSIAGAPTPAAGLPAASSAGPAVVAPSAVAADPSPAAPFLAAAEAGTPIDGAAFLRHLDQAVERRNALAPGATDEAFESDPPARGLLTRQDAASPAAGSEAPAPPTGTGPAEPTAAVPAVPVLATFPRVSAAAPAPEPRRAIGALGRRTALPAPLSGADLASVVAPATRTAPRPDVEVAIPERSSVDADVAEYGLIARGLSPAIARSVVLEAAAHGQPLDAGHRIDRATRAALARRIPQTAPRGGVRTMVIVGAPGAGRTSAVGALAAAHAGAGRRVLAVAMDAADGGAALAATLVGTDAELLVATGGATAAAAIRVARPDVCVVDTPAVHPSDDAAVRALAAELRALGADEVHLALPGTDQTTAALGALDGLQPLAPDALLMTHRDRAERPGGVVGASIARGLPIGYVTDGRAVALAEPARLARMVQP